MNRLSSVVAALTLAAMIVLAVLAAPGIRPAMAAAKAEDHTVLYYLIEMQRRVNRNCQGRALPAAPSLLPSEALRGMAMESMSSGRAAETVAAAAGLAGTPLIALSGVGNTPRQAFDSIMAGQCPALMGESYRHIGAAESGGRWLVIMAAAESGPARPGSGTGVETGVESGTGAESAAQGSGGKAAAPKASGWIDGGEVRYSADRQAEAAPAPPVPVGEMRLDAAGRPVGPLHPVEASVAEAFPEAGAGFAAAAPEIFANPDQKPLRDESYNGGASDQYQGSGSDSASNQGSYQGSGTGFIPPDAPGPFGVAAPPQRPDNSRPDVQPLTDNRPQAPPEAFVYTAPPGGSGGTGGMDTGSLGGAGNPDGAYAPEGPGGAQLRPLSPHLSPENAAGQRIAGASPAHPQGTGFAPADGSSTDLLLTLINAERALGGTCGGAPMPPATPLILSLALSDAASAHAADMAARGYFSSKTPDGADLGRRVSDAGYIWTQVAENLAKGQNSPQAVVMSWLGDAGQCKNLLDREFTEAGIGRDLSGRYWVLTLAAPALLDEAGPQLDRGER